MKTPSVQIVYSTRGGPVWLIWYAAARPLQNI